MPEVTSPSPPPSEAETTTWLTQDEQRVWRTWLAIDARLNIALARQLACRGLSVQDYEVLVALTDVEPGQRRVLELAAALAWERSRLSHHVKRMEARGLVSREATCGDARGAFVVITPEGRRAIEGAAPGHVDLVREVAFEHLTPADLEAFERITSAMLARLVEITGAPAQEPSAQHAPTPRCP